jgi:hypothetical protein
LTAENDGPAMSVNPYDNKNAPPVRGWRIFQKWGANKTFVGIVEARDPQSAIGRAISRYQITDAEHQKRLVAEPRVD